MLANCNSLPKEKLPEKYKFSLTRQIARVFPGFPEHLGIPGLIQVSRISDNHMTGVQHKGCTPAQKSSITIHRRSQ